jgi:predicted short-subunit dehydrogenase-like oxidoreductase (DUF2520 family)
MLIWTQSGSSSGPVFGLQLARSMLAAGLMLAGVTTRSAAARHRARRLRPGIPIVRFGAALPPCDAVLVAVPDDLIHTVSVSLAGSLPAPPRYAFHTSGALPALLLAPFEETGVCTGSFHPLVAFPGAGGPIVPLRGRVAAVEGNRRAVAARGEMERAGLPASFVTPALAGLVHESVEARCPAESGRG